MQQKMRPIWLAAIFLSLIHGHNAYNKGYGRGHSADMVLSDLVDDEVENRAVPAFASKKITDQLGAPCNFTEFRNLEITEFWIDYFRGGLDANTTKYEALTTLVQQANVNYSDSINTMASVCFLGLRLYECLPGHGGLDKVEYKCGCMQYPVLTKLRDETETPQCLVQSGENCAPKNSYDELVEMQDVKFTIFTKNCDDGLHCDPDKYKCRKTECNITHCANGTKSGESLRSKQPQVLLIKMVFFGATLSSRILL